MNLSVLLPFAATALLAGCVAAPVPYGGDPYVVVEPPPPRVEYVGIPPVIGHVWLAGYWDWTPNRYVWVPGRWSPPKAGHAWVPHRWERHGHANAWRKTGGRWEVRQGQTGEIRPGPLVGRPPPGLPRTGPGPFHPDGPPGMRLPPERPPYPERHRLP